MNTEYRAVALRAFVPSAAAVAIGVAIAGVVGAGLSIPQIALLTGALVAVSLVAPRIAGVAGTAAGGELESVVTDEIPKLVEAMKAVAAGNLTAEVGFSSTISAHHPALGKVEASFAEMTAELGKVVGTAAEISRRVQDGSDRLAQSSAESTQAANEVAGAIGSVADGAVSQAAVTDRVATDVGQIQTAVVEATGAVESVSTISEQAEQRAGEGKAQLDQATGAMERITSSFEDVSDTVATLADRSEKIEQIVDLIRSIAEQTNLLALNAAIEAARAGDAGRGFAVVASEVKALAEESARSTEDIAELVGVMRESSSDARRVTEAGRTGVEQGATIISDAAGAFASIVESINAVELEVQGVAAAVGQISAATGAIGSGVGELASVAQANSAVAEQVAASSEEMAATGSEIGDTAQDLAVTSRELAAALRGFTFGDASLDFASAISAHKAWKSRIDDFLSGKEEMHPEDVSSHRDCELGRWLYGSGLTTYGDLDEMQSLERDHQELHSQIKTVVQAHHSGNKSAVEAAYDELVRLSGNVVADLQELQHRT